MINFIFHDQQKKTLSFRKSIIFVSTFTKSQTDLVKNELSFILFDNHWPPLMNIDHTHRKTYFSTILDNTRGSARILD